jgi:hypothetical protein
VGIWITCKRKYALPKCGKLAFFFLNGSIPTWVINLKKKSIMEMTGSIANTTFWWTGVSFQEAIFATSSNSSQEHL